MPAPAVEAAAPVAAAPAAAELKEVHVPDIGGDEVEVTEIMVAIGDSIEEEQSLLTVEGDKASMEVPAPFAGVLKEIKIAAGDKVSTGSLVMILKLLALVHLLLQQQLKRQLRQLQQHLQQKKLTYQISAVMK